MIDIRHIMQAIPHRYPFLLIDRVVECEAGKRVVAIKNVSYNEPFFPGHFPGEPIMPGVLIVEALAQAAAVMMLRDMPDAGDKLVFFTGIDNARFRRTVVPGDQLRLSVEMVKLRATFCKVHGIAEVEGQMVAEADLMSALVDRSKD